jgi:hypothetical protein
VEGRTSVSPAVVERRLRVAGDGSAAARARQLVGHFRGERQRVDEARLLLNELVMGAQYEGVEFVDVRVMAFTGCLRLVVKRPHRRPMSQPRLQLTPAGQIGRLLIERLANRWGDNGLLAWCELEGEWIAADVPVYLSGAVQPST